MALLLPDCDKIPILCCINFHIIKIFSSFKQLYCSISLTLSVDPRLFPLNKRGSNGRVKELNNTCMYTKGFVCCSGWSVILIPDKLLKSMR